MYVIPFCEYKMWVTDSTSALLHCDALALSVMVVKVGDYLTLLLNVTSVATATSAAQAAAAGFIVH